MPVSRETLDEIALTQSEYDLIVQKLGREPNPVELGMFGALWSEHCGYKHSKPLLGIFPSESPRVLVASGEENAGVVDIGDGLAIVMKVESHNHPSAVEPYQGAATGVGGIIRDIFAMGARPIALLNSLRFGPLSESRNQFLFRGVIGGISGYGNCMGIPDVGGEIAFDSCYSDNPLVNAMCVGIVEHGGLVRASAVTPGNVLMLVGAETGRDGIHGASGLASRSFGGEREMRPTVQVGNPFLEKVLLEACLEVARTDFIEGMQDLGAAGLTSSAVECAARGNTGIDLDVSLVPRREQGMTPYEIMISESQERMLLIVKSGCEDDVKSIFDRWDISCVTIGRVTGSGKAKIFDKDQLVADISVALLDEAPQYRLQGVRPSNQEELHNIRVDELPLPMDGPGKVLVDLLGSPLIASKKWVYRQYDHEVQTNTVVKPGSDATVLRIRGSKKGIVLSIDGNGRHCYLDPYMGGALAVAEASRNVACAGGLPLAVTDCLNFGNPERPHVYYQLEECIKGMAAACRALGVPVVSGNVSLYNESSGHAIYPTPVVGALGLLENLDHHATSHFSHPGDKVFLLGSFTVDIREESLAGSEYLERWHGLVAGKPTIDLELEVRLQKCLVRLAKGALVHSMHDCSDGGLGVAIAESSIGGNMGFRGNFMGGVRWDVMLFGESPSRVVISLDQANLKEMLAVVEDEGVPVVGLGIVTDDQRFEIENLLDLPMADLIEAHSDGLEKALAG